MQGNGSRFGEDRGLREGEGRRLFPNFFVMISKYCWSFFDRAGDSKRVFERGWFGREGFFNERMVCHLSFAEPDISERSLFARSTALSFLADFVIAF